MYAILSRREEHPSRPPGRLIDVQGHSMHLLATGAGSPTVLGSGAAGYFGLWNGRRKSEHTRVVSYDRAGWVSVGKRQGQKMRIDCSGNLTNS